jgi:mRNA interferase RelE/StbE
VSSRSVSRVFWTRTALERLTTIGDRPIQQEIFDASKRLEADPEKHGKPLRENLFGFRSLRVIGQRYRLVYSVDPSERLVHVVVVGLRREGSRDDVYELAQKLVRLGLAPSARKKRRSPAPARRRKKK